VILDTVGFAALHRRGYSFAEIDEMDLRALKHTVDAENEMTELERQEIEAARG
jgi:hypothetical protein